MKTNGSLNRIYRLVWSHVTQGWVAVPENSTGQGKRTSRTLAAAVLSLSAALAHGGPTGGSVTSGAGSIAQSGGTTTVTQGSAHLSLNWQSFNVGAQESVNFVQPSASAIAVNRIQDVNGSQVLGRISANGQVYLINPHGILFGQGAQVNVGALVASTLDLSDASLHTGSRSFSGAGTGSIVNHGSLDAAPGGYVALVGHSVMNQGSITAPLGFVGLGAGNAVTLSFLGNRMVGIQVDQSALNALADNGGLIRADGGQVVMNAGAKDALLASVVNNSGTVEARTVEHQEGRIVLLGGMVAGTVALSGTLDASAASASPGAANGGFIETSAAHVRIAEAARVTTAAVAGGPGTTGTWLIDPTNFTISEGSAALSGSGIGAATLAQSLLSNNVSIATAPSGNEAGDINVNAAVSWIANTLTLTAHRDININAVMSAKGAAILNLQPVGHVNVGFNNDGSFAGRVDFLHTDGTARSGAGFLKIGSKDYSVIGSEIELRAMNATTYYALGRNISTTGAFTAMASFTSGFDGLGHTVANLNITGMPGVANTGLFATATGASIQNVGLLGGSISGAAGTGALVGYLDNSTVRNSYSSASVTGGAGTGGLVGSMVGSSSGVVNSHATGNVGQSAGGAGTGGLVGSIASAGGDIINSYATGNVTSTGAATGGLVGSTAASGVIDGSYATGRVKSDDAGTGGLVGSSAASGGIRNSYAMGSVESVAAGTGGLVGSNTSGAIYRSYAIGSVNGGGAGTGGLVGSNTSGTISQSFAAGAVSGSAHSIAAPGADATKGASTGGLIGSNGGAILDTYAAGNVTGYAAGTGGLIGSNSGTVTNSYAAGQVAGAVGVGGLIGSGTLTNSHSYRLEGNAPVTASSAAGTPVSSGDLATFSTSVATQAGSAAWDFNNVWLMPASTASYLYPVFKGLVKEMTVTAGSASKTYDGQAYTGGNTSTTSSSVNPDLINIAFAAAPPMVNAGTYAITPTVTVTNAYLTPYFHIHAVSGTLTVAPAALTLTGMSATSRTYNGTTDASLSGATVSGLVGTETVALSAQFDNKNAGTGKAITVAMGDGVNGGLASNYTLAAGQVANAGITAAALTLTGMSATTRTYNGTTDASLSGGTVSGLVGTETVALSAQFDNKNAGTGKAITVAMADGVNGGLASNYTLAAGQVVGASITAKAVSGTAAASDKIYDGSTSALVTGTVSDLVAGESLSLSGQFDTKDVGTGKAVSVSLVNGAGGGLASNYSMTSSPTVSANITTKALTATATADNKTYDGTTSALAELSLLGLVAGETLGSSTTASFNDANVMPASQVKVDTVTLSNGTGKASNYTLAAGQVVGASITAKAVSATAAASDKIYDGSTSAVVTGTVFDLVGSQSLSLSGQFDTKDVGTGKAVSVSLVNGAGGGLASNYRLPALSAPLTADIRSVQGAAPAVVQDQGGDTTDTSSRADQMESGHYSSRVTARFSSGPSDALIAEKVIDGGLNLP